MILAVSQVVSDALYRPCNPSLTVPELIQNLKLSKSTLIIAHADSLEVVKAAAKHVGIPERRILVLQDQDQVTESPMPNFGECKTVEALIQEGLRSGETVTGQRLRDGGSKTQVAFYSSSSGTTGPPKVSNFAISRDKYC